MLKLFHVPQTRSTRPRWLLEELGVPYELVRLDPKRGDNRAPDYLRINPQGHVPALVDGETAFFETGAIVAYLADKFPEKKLAPALGSPERGPYLQWLFYGVTSLEAPVAVVSSHTSARPADARVPMLVEEGKEAFGKAAAALEKALAGHSFLVADQFSAADVIVGSTLNWAKSLGLLEGREGLLAYVQRLSERPAFQRARAD